MKTHVYQVVLAINISEKKLLCILHLPRQGCPTLMYQLVVLITVLFMSACSSSVETANSELSRRQSIPADWFNAGQLAGGENKLSDEPLISIPKALQHILKQAQLDNLTIKMALARLQISQATKQSAQATTLPKVDAILGSSREQFIWTDENRIQSQYSTNFRASWELDLWQKLANTRAATQAELSASEFDLAAAKQSVMGQVLLRYLDIQQGNELVYWSKQNLARQQRRVKMTAQRLDSGLSSTQDYRLALNSLHTIEADLNQQKLTLNLAKQRFNLLVGRYPSTPIASNDLEIGLPTLIKVISPKKVLTQRPDLLAAEFRLMSAYYQSKAADKGHFPDINLSANLQVNRADFSQLFDWQYWLANLTANLVQPLFSNGAIDARIKQQQARQDLALAQYQQNLLIAWQEIEQALYTEQLQRQRFVALKNAYTQIDNAEKRTLENYHNGLASSFELLNIQTRRIAAKVNLIRSRFAILSNRVNLILALGEPFPISSEIL